MPGASSFFQRCARSSRLGFLTNPIFDRLFSSLNASMPSFFTGSLIILAMLSPWCPCRHLDGCHDEAQGNHHHGEVSYHSHYDHCDQKHDCPAQDTEHQDHEQPLSTFAPLLFKVQSTQSVLSIDLLSYFLSAESLLQQLQSEDSLGPPRTPPNERRAALLSPAFTGVLLI